jgi:hypothetical protein
MTSSIIELDFSMVLPHREHDTIQINSFFSTSYALYYLKTYIAINYSATIISHISDQVDSFVLGKNIAQGHHRKKRFRYMYTIDGMQNGFRYTDEFVRKGIPLEWFPGINQVS